MLFSPFRWEYFISQVIVPLIVVFTSIEIISFFIRLLSSLLSQAWQVAALACWFFQYDYLHEQRHCIIVIRPRALSNTQIFCLFKPALLTQWSFVFCPNYRFLLFTRLDDEFSSFHGDFKILSGNIRKMSIPVCLYTLRKSKKILDDIWTILMVVSVYFMFNLLTYLVQNQNAMMQHLVKHDELLRIDSIPF